MSLAMMSADGGGSIKAVKAQLETLASLVSTAQSEWTAASESAVGAHANTHLDHSAFGAMPQTSPFATVYNTASTVYGEVLTGLMADITAACNNLDAARLNLVKSEDEAAAALNQVFTGVMQTDDQFAVTAAQESTAQQHAEDLVAAQEIQAEAPGANPESTTPETAPTGGVTATGSDGTSMGDTDMFTSANDSDPAQ